MELSHRQHATQAEQHLYLAKERFASSEGDSYQWDLALAQYHATMAVYGATAEAAAAPNRSARALPGRSGELR